MALLAFAREKKHRRRRRVSSEVWNGDYHLYLQLPGEHLICLSGPFISITVKKDRSLNYFVMQNWLNYSKWQSKCPVNASFSFFHNRKTASGTTNLEMLLTVLGGNKGRTRGSIKGQEGSQMGSRLVRLHIISLTSICFPESNTETVASASPLHHDWWTKAVEVQTLSSSSASSHASITLPPCSVLHTSCIFLPPGPYSSFSFCSETHP